MADSNYTRGEMNISDHSETFGGFMSFSVYGGAIIIVSLLFPILVFGAGLAWPAALLTSVVIGVFIGIGLKFKAQWYAILIGASIVLAGLIGVLSLVF